MVASLLSLAENYRRVGKVHWPKGKSPSAQTGRQRTSTWPMSTFPDLFLSGPTALNARCEHKKEGKRIVRAEVFCHVAARTNSLPKEQCSGLTTDNVAQKHVPSRLSRAGPTKRSSSGSLGRTLPRDVCQKNSADRPLFRDLSE